LTQRAHKHEFEQARAFLDALPQPQIIVPGNHDVPLHNVYARFRRSFHSFRRYISEDLEPFYSDAQMAIMGANTARSLAWKGGRVNSRQVTRIAERLCTLGPEVTKILVTHHPFDLPPNYHAGMLASRAGMAVEKLVRCGVDLLLAGHIHLSHTGHTALRYRTAGRAAIFVQAGTLSMRHRGEPNSFNVIRIKRNRMEVRRLSWHPGTSVFAVMSTDEFHQTSEGWGQVYQAHWKNRAGQRSAPYRCVQIRGSESGMPDVILARCCRECRI
jgi:3',5'-cyclic AMP phosphodiesterase CpdA